jgi:hypothetical protein
MNFHILPKCEMKDILMTQNARLPSQLASILDDISRAFANSLYYPALVVALTVPEICVTLCWDRNQMVKRKHYAEFIDKYTVPSELGLEGESCYSLRGGVIHRGNAVGHTQFPASHVIFSVPETRASIHALSIEMLNGNKAAMFELESFCAAIIKGAHKWYSDHKDHPMVIKNMPNLLSWRPLGMPPFVGGVPVIGSGS